MSVGSDPIECCVRGRFLCVCVTARRRGFRGGAFCVGAPRNFFRPVSRAFPASVSRRGGIGVGFLFPLCCAFRLVPALRRGPFASGLRETSFDLFRAPSRHRFRGGGGSAWASFSRCAAHFGSCRLFAVGLLRRGSEKLLSTCFARLPGIGFAAGGDRRGLPFPAVLRISARAGSSPPGLLPITDDGRTSFVPHLGRGAGGTVSSLYASAAGVLAGGFLVPAGFGRKCGSHSTGRKRAACCGPFGPGRCLRRDPRPKRTDRLSRYGRDNVGRARGSGCRKTCRGAIRTLPASRCGR